MALPAAFTFVPTAVHWVVVVQLTPLRLMPCDPGGAVAVCTTHVLPFQRSMSQLVRSEPTAVQARIDLHETPFIEPLDFDDVSGASGTDQALPFQLASIGAVPVGILSEMPATTQKDFDTQLTARSPEPIIPAGCSSSARDVHFAPFHHSASDCPALTELAAVPTAMHAAADTHDTPLSTVPDEPLGSGFVIGVQRVPL